VTHAVAAKPAAESAVAKLVEVSADLRACALLGVDGEVLASSADAPWSERAAELWEAADAARPDAGPVTQVQVAGESGEVFAVRDGGVSAIAVTDRFALGSLMLCDLRAALRELSGEGAS